VEAGIGLAAMGAHTIAATVDPSFVLGYGRIGEPPCTRPAPRW
jgi:hypothetical protein